MLLLQSYYYLSRPADAVDLLSPAAGGHNRPRTSGPGRPRDGAAVPRMSDQSRRGRTAGAGSPLLGHHSPVTSVEFNSHLTKGKVVWTLETSSVKHLMVIGRLLPCAYERERLASSSGTVCPQ